VIKQLVLVGVSIMTLASCNNQQEPINVVGNSWLGYQPFYAQHLLHREQQPSGMHITMLVSDVSVMRMLTNEAASVAMLSLDNAISLNSRTNLDFCIALALSSSNGADAIMMHPNFNDKLNSSAPIRVGMEDSALARYVLSRWLETSNIDPARIEREIILPNSHASAFARGSFDLLVTYAPFTTRLLSSGAIPVFTSAEIPDEIIDTVIIRRDTWHKYKERLRPLISTSWDQALAAAQQPDSDIFNAMAQLSEFSTDDLLSTMAQLKFYDATASREFLAERYPEVHNTVAGHLVEVGVVRDMKSLPVCEGIL
jgi:NitT/TauT family transport system substrate-binding protein